MMLTDLLTSMIMGRFSFTSVIHATQLRQEAEELVCLFFSCWFLLPFSLPPLVRTLHFSLARIFPCLFSFHPFLSLAPFASVFHSSVSCYPEAPADMAPGPSVALCF